MITWKKERQRFSSANNLYSGKRVVASVWWDGLTSKTDDLKYAVAIFDVRLKGNSKTETEAVARAERAFAAWLESADLQVKP